MTILVTGGAGYIGSVMTRKLLDENFKVVVLDNLSRGFKDAIDQRASFIEGELLREDFVDNLFKTNHVDAVIHFAGYISMAESMENPTLYFRNNFFSAVNVLEALRKNSGRYFIFSSSAGVYGNPTKIPIPEDHIKRPTNPYGESKLMVEQALAWYQRIFGISFAALRYFNAAGASLDSSLGERHMPETHIIPLAIKSAMRNTTFTIYGKDYGTKDGTAVRDYIHVEDLAEAHVLALKKLQKSSGAFYYNVGTGIGHSNKEVVDMVKKISGVDFSVVFGDRRSGDAESLVADPGKIVAELGFSPRYSELEVIVRNAWEWHKKLK